MRATILVMIALALPSLAPTAAEAQRRPFVLSPEYAASVQTNGGRTRVGVAVQTFSARLNVRPHQQVSPWISAGRMIRGSTCSTAHCDDGWLIVPGVRIDAMAGHHERGVRPYAIAGAGVFVDAGETVHLLPSLGAGARWPERNTFAPRVELRWERFAGRDYAMVGIGVGLRLGAAIAAKQH